MPTKLGPEREKCAKNVFGSGKKSAKDPAPHCKRPNMAQHIAGMAFPFMVMLSMSGNFREIPEIRHQNKRKRLREEKGEKREEKNRAERDPALERPPQLSR